MTPDLTPARLWLTLPPEVRSLAAKSFYAHDWGSPFARREAEVAIARSLKAREEFVRKLPIEKRIGYLATAVRPDESLAGSLLLALHLEQRRSLLAAFLDALGIPHKDGLIAESHELTPPPPDKLAIAARTLYDQFPADEVTTYLRTLLASDPEIWGGLRSAIESS